ncbi:unnamed protein product [Plutella xylostella]|uniref:(diamondback moth) hypothetical protein n=1 Tax=Plutella xylostella TaxID=51655 RepID=A0A8S4EV15_PLUXY|nr:unnamed protein product [Plutella xylostella]
MCCRQQDFCHWGARFRYQWRDQRPHIHQSIEWLDKQWRDQRPHIHQSIEWLDKQGMNIIETLDPRAFSSYLDKYNNTICGRHPIAVLLQVSGTPSGWTGDLRQCVHSQKKL